MSTERLQLVILLMDDRLYAIDSEHFLEVMRGAVATPIPFVPAYIEGLVNVEGKIATQMDLGRLFSLRDTPSAGEELAFIKTGRSLCALRVQQVISIINTQDVKIDLFSDKQADVAASSSRCVAGEFVHDGQNILLLDHREIGLLVQAREVPAGSGGLAGRVRVRDSETASSHVNHYLVAYAGEERFGFAIHRITELVKAGYCTPIPGAAKLVSGLSLVRGQPVLTTRLQDLLGRVSEVNAFEIASPDEWIILVEQDDLFIGMTVDRIVGIEEYEQSSIVAVNHPDSTVRGVVENHAGELTMLVEPASLLSGEMATLLRRYAPAMRQDKTADVTEFKACLAVTIREELFAIPLNIVNRVIQYKALESVNDASQAILGAIDVDGRIVPVINMHTGIHTADTGWSEYVIVEGGQSEYALRVNQTDRVIDLPVKNISRSKNTANPFAIAVAQFESSIYSVFNHEYFDRIHTT